MSSPSVRTPFLHATFSHPSRSETAIRTRLRLFAMKIRAAKVQGTSLGLEGTTDLAAWDKFLDDRDTYELTRRISRRANALAERCRRASGTGHLREEDLKQLAPVRDGVRLVPIPSEHEADVIASEMHGEFPWLAPVTEAMWHAMRLSVRRGHAGFRHPPFLLDGPPGIGKSTWARAFADRIGLPNVAIDASGESAGFGVIGLQRGWKSARQGRPLDLVLRSGIGNPVIVLDELEKVGTAHGDDGAAYKLSAALLPLLEPVTARRWNCPYFQVPFDMSWMSWVLSVNNASLLPSPLRSRCRHFHLRNLTFSELAAFVLREQDRRDLSDALVEPILSALDAGFQLATPPSLRTALRLLDLAEVQDILPTLH